MKLPSFFLVLILSFTGRGLAAAQPATLALGSSLPAAAAELELTSADGDQQTLGSLAGDNGLLILFTSNTCPYSIDWRDRIPLLNQRGEQQNIPLVLVNANAKTRKTDDSPTAMAAQVAEHFAGTEYWVDKNSRLADLLGARRTPEAFLFDAGGTLVYHGAIDDHSGPAEQVQSHYLNDAMEALSSGRTPAELGLETSTAPLGCKIQRPRKRRKKADQE